MIADELLILNALAELSAATGRSHFKCDKVIEHALRSAGKLSIASARALAGAADIRNKHADRLYKIIMRMSHDPANLIKGGGNLGSPDRRKPAAHFHYTECGITEQGLEYLRSLQGK